MSGRRETAVSTRFAGRWSALRSTDRQVIGWIGVNLLVFGHVVLFETPLWLTYAYNGLLYAIGAGIAVRSAAVRDVFVLGSVAGVLEVGVDAFLVSTGSLVYPDSLPMLLGSPLYMPLSWALVVTYFGYLGRRLDEIAGPLAATVGPSVAAMVLVGFFEYGAHFAGIWRYEFAPLAMLGTVPAFIVVAEGAMFAALYWLVRLRRPLLGGVAFAAVISVSYVGSYALFAALGA
ncbi:DUF6989 domain-containing protein [Halobellus limi]|uniref:DUF6989 domain-containing protein n=1 Tax=Halobellus limi TaxID=699433 RepID=A0A1H5YJI3_9EURY|nr:hypothetical protein [Halobellus limi]QCC48429.1 hypothetical protein DV707_12555 [Halobellus limi]SEG24228.1 hypothetical protein SAMN04488133_1621 [Halobellus limi]